MARRSSVVVLDLETQDPFTISRGGSDFWPTVVVEVEEGGVVSRGEAAPRAYYDEDPVATARLIQGWLDGHPALAEAAPADLGALGEASLAARCAVDLLLHDHRAQRRGLPLVQHLAEEYDLSPATPPVSSFTIGLDTPEAMAEKARRARGLPILKVKLGTDRDLEILAAVRAASSAELRIDANAAWSLEETQTKVASLVELGVTLVEQPLGRRDLDGYRRLHGTLALPIIADESCRTLGDVQSLAGCVDGINLKLSKCGGLLPAVEMLREARRLGLRVMVGCFIETSLAITAGAALAHFVDDADLDGAALLAHDPFFGATLDRGRIVMPQGPGLGAAPRLRS